MIEPKEIQEKSLAFGVNTSDIQRDYVFGWFLFGMFSISSLGERLFLKGGNALRKCYFENTRYSGDLDLGLEGDIDRAFLQEEINKICDFVHEQTGIIFSKDMNKVKEKFPLDNDLMAQLKVYEARVFFRDFHGQASEMILKIKMDITRFDKVYLPLQNQALIHPYSDFEQTRVAIRCSKLEEIVATKIKCLLQREHPPDLFDFVYTTFFNQSIALDKKEVISVFLKKTIFEPSPGMVKNILLQLPMDFFRMFWNKNISCAQHVIFNVETAITKFRETVEDMFSPYPATSYADSAFFPVQFRNPIMQAGRSQTLLKMIYKNSERMVEPYALKYKEPKTRAPREYFFVHELSGGSQEPGIRTYVAENVQSVENTDIKFTPREGYDIELCKAGEPIEDRYFGDPNRPKVQRSVRPRMETYKTPRRTAKSSATGYSYIKYTYQCSACLKKITKRTMDSAIGPHKNRYGGACYGRYGYLISSGY